MTKKLICCVILLICCATYSVQSTVITSMSMTIIEMPTSAHFMTPEGESIVVAAGVYEVTCEGAALRLSPIDSEARVLIVAEASSHEENLEAPAAIAVAGETDEDRDVVEVGFFSPDGQYLSSIGSISGIQTRGLFKK